MSSSHFSLTQALTKDLRLKHTPRIFRASAVRTTFYISICILTLSTQHTMFVLLSVVHIYTLYFPYGILRQIRNAQQ